MDYEILILDKLLDKYEKRTVSSNRRVRIFLSKNEVKIPSIESSGYSEFRDSMLELKSKGFIEFDWERQNFIIKSIWLNIENAGTVYQYLERQPLGSKAKNIVSIIEKSLQKITLKWIREYLETEYANIFEKEKLKGIWSKEQELICNFLTAFECIDSLNGNSVSMRAFSVKAYGDSKKFEREIKPYVIPVVKRYEPNLNDIEEVSEREVLAQVGIIMMPEIFEFCGNIRIQFSDGMVDFSPILHGSCISGECVFDIQDIEILNTDRIIFIENKTNYSEYCLNSKNKRELVVYHGGFYSPQRGEFFKKLCTGIDIPVYFWGDIDYGGFKMFVRLKNNIINTLHSLNMDLHSYNRYKSQGLSRNDDYIAKLKLLKLKPDYEIFF